MEYAKDIILEQGKVLEEGLERKKSGRKSIVHLITEHKMMTTIVTATISFMILDIVLISSFVNVLGKIWAWTKGSSPFCPMREERKKL